MGRFWKIIGFFLPVLLVGIAGAHVVMVLVALTSLAILVALFKRELLRAWASYFAAFARETAVQLGDRASELYDALRGLLTVVLAISVLGGVALHYRWIDPPEWLLHGVGREVFAALDANFSKHPDQIVRLPVAAAGLLSFLVCVALGVSTGIALVYYRFSTGLGHALGAAVRYIRAPSFTSFKSPPAHDGRVVLCQISDLHMTACGQPYEIEAGSAKWPEGAPQPDAAELRSRVQRIIEEISRRQPDVLAITGDITDLGEEDQWSEVERALSGLPAETHLMLLPGNHDIAINKSEAPDPRLTRREERKGRFVRALERLERGPLKPRLPAGSGEGGELGKLFPRRLDLPGGIRVFGLDSNQYESHYVLSNAMGLIGERQLARLKRALHRGSGPVIVLLHHHVGHLPAAPRVTDKLQDVFMMALDSQELLGILSGYHRQDPRKNAVLVLHGHKHMYFTGSHQQRGGHLHIHAHPSSTMGQEIGGALDAVPRYSLVQLSDDGRWIVECVDLAQAAGAGGVPARRRPARKSA